MTQLVLNLPWPPSVNAYWRSPNKGPLAGRTLISVAGREFRSRVDGIVVRDQGACLWVQRWALSRLSVAIYAYPPDKRRRDLDNLPKAVLDALTHAGVWADDEQIDALSIQRCGLEKGGRIGVVIAEIEQCEKGISPP